MKQEWLVIAEHVGIKEHKFLIEQEAAKYDTVIVVCDECTWHLHSDNIDECAQCKEK